MRQFGPLYNMSYSTGHIWDHAYATTGSFMHTKSLKNQLRLFYAE